MCLSLNRGEGDQGRERGPLGEGKGGLGLLSWIPFAWKLLLFLSLPVKTSMVSSPRFGAYLWLGSIESALTLSATNLALAFPCTCRATLRRSSIWPRTRHSAVWSVGLQRNYPEFSDVFQNFSGMTRCCCLPNSW
jgi:hypothetical protein